MHAHEVVPHIEQGNRMAVVLHTLTEGISKPGEAAHLHLHGQALPLHVTGGHVLLIRFCDDGLPFGPKTLRGAVPILPCREK